MYFFKVVLTLPCTLVCVLSVIFHINQTQTPLQHSRQTTPITPTSLRRSITSDNNGHEISITVCQPSFIMSQSSEMSENQPATYILDGACGRSKATLDSKKSAITVFNKYLHSSFRCFWSQSPKLRKTSHQNWARSCNIFLVRWVRFTKISPRMISWSNQLLWGHGNRNCATQMIIRSLFFFYRPVPYLSPRISEAYFCGF